MTDVDTRVTRDLDTREVNERPKSWQPASALPDPDKVPGYTYRWVRVSNGGEADPKNIMGKLGSGWEPVTLEEQPKYKYAVALGKRFNAIRDQFSNNIEIGGLLLCKIPDEFVEQRKAHFERITQSQMESVDNNFMRENDPRMPLFAQRKSSVKFGKGN